MATKKFCAYLRVSTRKQGASGLGLEAQEATCREYIKSQGVDKFERKFVDVESGTHRNRQGLWEAIDYCQQHDACLVVAKLDRLARDVEFTFKIMNTGIDIHFCDMPIVNTVVLGVFASVAQYERELISQRTKAALERKKKRGERIGREKGCDNTIAVQISREKRRERAKNDKTNKTIWEICRKYIPEGKDTPTYDGFVKAYETLDRLGVKTPTGLELSPERVRQCFYNLKRIMLDDVWKKAAGDTLINKGKKGGDVWAY